VLFDCSPLWLFHSSLHGLDGVRGVVGGRCDLCMAGVVRECGVQWTFDVQGC